MQNRTDESGVSVHASAAHTAGETLRYTEVLMGRGNTGRRAAYLVYEVHHGVVVGEHRAHRHGCECRAHRDGRESVREGWSEGRR